MLIACTFIMFFFFNDTATTEIYTLSLHDALPISDTIGRVGRRELAVLAPYTDAPAALDRKSTRLNSSHGYISYAVFCLKKKRKRASVWRPSTAGEVSGTSVNLAPAPAVAAHASKP